MRATPLHKPDHNDEQVARPGNRPTEAGLAGAFHHYQSTAGNLAVARLVRSLPDRAPTGLGAAKADEDEGAPAQTEETPPTTETTPEPTAGSAGTPEASAAPTSGTIPDQEPDMEPSHEKGAGMLKEDFNRSSAGSSTGASGTQSSATPTGALKLVTGDVGVNVNTPQVDGETGRSRADSLASGAITNAFTNPDTSPSSSAFGSESFKAGYKDAAFTTAGGTVTVNFTLNINCPWGTNNGGRTDVPSGTSSVVTKDNYKQIVSDVTPSLVEKSWRAPRTKFWSETICKRHERFHSTDDKAWSEGAGKEVVKNYLNGKTVNASTASTDVNTHLANAVKAMDTANFQFYTGGASSYLSYAGEERAFGDGKQPYLDLAAAVKSQGEQLEAAATPSTPPSTGSGGTTPTTESK